jgi:hypothetical protein
MAIDEAANYHLLLKHPDRSEPEYADFTSFTGELKEDDTFSLPEKGEWRVEEIEHRPELPHARLVCVPAD